MSGRKVGGHQHSAAFFELHIGTKHHQAVTLRRVVLRCTSSSQPLVEQEAVVCCFVLLIR